MIKIFVWLLAFALLSCSEHDHSTHNDHDAHDKQRADYYYTCSMHPEIREDQPGRCPICHMSLTKVARSFDESDDSISSRVDEEKWRCENYPDVQSYHPGPCPIDGSEMVKIVSRELPGATVAQVRLRKAQMGHFSPSYFQVTPMQMHREVRLLGTVLQAEEKKSNIPARVAGRVERVYVQSTGAHIRQGDKILDLFSPRLISAGEEFLLAKRNHNTRPSDNSLSLLNQSKERLRQWGITEQQLTEWVRLDSVPEVISLYSQVNGIVVERNAVNGRYFNEGESFFDLVDLSVVWLEVDVFESDSALIQMGQHIEIRFNALPGEVFHSEIDFVSPVIDRASRTLKVRASLHNESGRLRPGMIAEAFIKVELGGHELVVPRSALIDTGRRQVVWTKESSSRFSARLVRTGHTSQGYVQILDGLEEDEMIVLEGNFVLDAQAQIFGGYEPFAGEEAPSARDPHAGH